MLNSWIQRFLILHGKVRFWGLFTTSLMYKPVDSKLYNSSSNVHVREFIYTRLGTPSFSIRSNSNAISAKQGLSAASCRQHCFINLSARASFPNNDTPSLKSSCGRNPSRTAWPNCCLVHEPNRQPSNVGHNEWDGLCVSDARFGTFGQWENGKRASQRGVGRERPTEKSRERERQSLSSAEAGRENQRMIMRNLGLGFLWFHHNNTYKW